MQYFEVITDVTTGESTKREFSQDEIDAILKAQQSAAEIERKEMRLSFAQMLIGLVERQWISEADGIGWLSGTLPPSVVSTINLLPAEDRFAATAKCLRPSYVYRLDQIVLLMAKVRGVSDADVDALFRDYASR